MPPVQKSSPDRATRVRRMWRMLAIGAVLLGASMTWAYAISSPSTFSPAALSSQLSLLVSVVYPLALGMLVAAGAGFAMIRRWSPRALFVAVTCCVIAIALLTWVGLRAPFRFEYRDGRIVYTIFLTGTPRMTVMPRPLSGPTMVYGLPVTVVGPQSAVVLLPFAALPLILRCPAKKSAESQPPDTPN